MVPELQEKLGESAQKTECFKKNSVCEVARGLLGEDRELAIGFVTMQAVRWVSMSGINYCLDVSLQTESHSPQYEACHRECVLQISWNG